MIEITIVAICQKLPPCAKFCQPKDQRPGRQAVWGVEVTNLPSYFFGASAGIRSNLSSCISKKTHSASGVQPLTCFLPPF